MNKILVKLDSNEEEVQTKAGLYMPTDSTIPQGEVVAVGDGTKDEPMRVQVGDKVILRMKGASVTINYESYNVVEQSDVLCIL